MQYLKSIQELKECISKRECYLFGAGKVAHVLLKWVYKEHGNIKGAIVSEKRNNPDEILGTSVFSLSEIHDNTNESVIVALLEKNQIHIEDELRNIFDSRIFFLTDALYYEIEKQNLDYEVEILHTLKGVKKDIADIRKNDKNNQLYYPKFFWENLYEKKIVEKNWGKYYLQKDFQDRLLNLIRGLDIESIDIISLIVNRHKKYLENDISVLDLFTVAEKNELQKQKDDFWNLIVEVTDNLYMYRGYFLTEKVFETSVFYYKHGISKVQNIEKIKDGVIFDVGGYVGDSVLVLNELKPRKIYTFEALPLHCEKMKTNLAINNITNAHIECIALSNYNGKIDFDVSGSSSNAVHRDGVNVIEQIEVEVRTLDDYVMEKNIDNIKLIKVDIEGGEQGFLEGAKETITKYKPTLLLSIYHNVHDFFEIKPMIESWNLGYTFKVFKSINGNVTNEVLLIAEVI